jgi:ribonuclease M5
MVKVREVILVEGRYDKNTLRQLVDAPILETKGFGIFKNRQMQAYLREVAQKRGVIILTDADGAGFVIRNFLKGILPKEQVKHAYIPDVYGKERRKAAPGKEGKLGVEGMKPETLLEALRRAGATLEGEASAPRNEITKLDLYEAGLTGGANSAAKRKALLDKLRLPERLSANGLLEALNLIYTKESFLAIIEELS